jgi:GWxTD domain-containing protein
MRLVRSHIAGVFGLAIVLLLPAKGQDQGRHLPRDEAKDALFMDLLGFATPSPDTSRLDVYLRVGYDLLSFVKTDERYGASYEVSVTLIDSTETQLVDRTWTENLSNIPVEETESSAGYKLLRTSLAARPGNYVVACAVRDLDSKAVTHVRKKFNLRRFSPEPFAMSDLMLLSKVASTGGKLSITPNVTGNVGSYDGPFGIFFEVYARSGPDTVRCESIIKGKEPGLAYRRDTLLVVRPGRNDVVIQIPHDSLGLGDYVVAVGVEPRYPLAPDKLQPYAIVTKPIMVRWSGMPMSVKDIDLAIEQLTYIARESELSKLNAAKTLDEKQKAFAEFWKARDPNPSTPRNERMIEFYQRVDYANKHFTHYREGWRTDMGMVYIIFGQPGSVDRHPFEMDSKPYEIWSYFDQNFSVIFVDQTGFGDYRLITPISDLLSRRRD